MLRDAMKIDGERIVMWENKNRNRGKKNAAGSKDMS
jgi:hypothetical protein